MASPLLINKIFIFINYIFKNIFGKCPITKYLRRLPAVITISKTLNLKL